MKLPLTRFLLIAATLGLIVGTGFGQAFSVAPGGPSALPPDAIFTPGPAPILPSGAGNIDGLSFGRTAASFAPGLPLQFSVSVGATGTPGSAVLGEATAPLGPDQTADIFVELPPFGAPSGNAHVFDGNGFPNVSPGPSGALGLIEPTMATPGAPSDNVDAWDNRSGPLAAFGMSVFYSFDTATSPSGSGADVFIFTPPGPFPAPSGIYAGFGSLGLLMGDDIDALVVFDDGDLVFGAIDTVMFSLTPTSPSLPGLPGGSPGNIFTVTGPGSSILLYRSDIALGLTAGSDVNALDVVPEPGTTAFLGIGMLLLWQGMSRSRSRKC